MNKEKLTVKLISILLVFSLVFSATAVSFAGTSAKYTPGQVVTTSLKFNSNDELVFKWKKINKNCTGYQIQYADNVSFNNDKKITLKSKNTISKKIKNYKNIKGSLLIIRIRAYNKVNGKTYYGKWSTFRVINVKEHQLSKNFNLLTEYLRKSKDNSFIMYDTDGNAYGSVELYVINEIPVCAFTYITDTEDTVSEVNMFLSYQKQEICADVEIGIGFKAGEFGHSNGDRSKMDIQAGIPIKPMADLGKTTELDYIEVYTSDIGKSALRNIPRNYYIGLHFQEALQYWDIMLLSKTMLYDTPIQLEDVGFENVIYTRK